MAVFICPECDVKKRVEDGETRKIKCPECGAVMERRKAARAETDEAVEDAERPAKLKAKAGKARKWDADDDERTTKKGMSALVIAAIIGGGVFALLACLGAVGTTLFFVAGTPQPMVAKVEAMPVVEAAPMQPMVIKEAPPVGKPPPPVVQPKPAVEVPKVVTGHPDDVPAGWRYYEPASKTYSAWLPKQGNFGDIEQSKGIPGLGIIRLKLARLEQDGGPSYNVGVVTLPLKLKKMPPTEAVKLFLDSYVKEFNGTVTKDVDITQGKVEGKEYVIKTDKGHTRLRLYAASGQPVSSGNVYRAEIAGTQEQAESPEAQMFLDSFKLAWTDTGLQRMYPKKKTGAPKEK